MRELDHLHIELAGSNLIEASAGTGKTYAIACLYLRLLVELDLSPEKILVVTYTEAATEELRGRIRARIRELLGVLDGAATGDLFLLGLRDNLNGRGPSRAQARDRLDRALKSFDQASIFTIHGFCLRALQDNAFESGSLYDTELVTDQTDLLQEVADDFWRRHFFAEPAPLIGYALRQGITSAYFAGFLREMLGNPKLQVLPAYSPQQIAVIEEQSLFAFNRVRQMWGERQEEICSLILTDKGLSRAKGAYHPELLAGLFEAMSCYALSDNPYELFEGFHKLSSSGLSQGKKATGALLVHEFFELCEQLLQRVGERFLALRCELLAFAAQRLPSRKRELNVRCFDDLLTGLYDALNGAQGDQLALSLRQKYRAALIDEFQDTDPVQFDIFRKLYAGADAPLFLIGDPKQAIYSFRGADIFAYLEAAAGVPGDRRFTLTSNWRSTPRLLDAFNAVFDRAANPFVFQQIGYHPIQAGRKEGGARLDLTGADPAPLQLWYLPQDENGKESSVGRATKAVPVAVAAEIARLLSDGAQGKALIDGRGVLPEDIAVIVRSHRQAALVQQALAALVIPSVMRSDASIFATREARELCAVLAAIASPGNEPKVRAALVTDVFGFSGDRIALLLEQEPLWEPWLEKFRAFQQCWLERGFMVMAQGLLSREGVRGRLLAHADGERRLTNLLHCFEILHAASQQRGLGAEGLVTWLGERISSGDRSGEYPIRLETDEKAVKILTIHVSKGLEYPIVFCPFLWGGVRGDDEVIAFHHDYRLCKDFGSPDRERHRVAAHKESLAENLRLLYVALTRAKFRCYLVAGKISDRTGKNRPETSPLSYLFHASPTTREADDLVGALAGQVKKLSLEETIGQLQALAARDPGAITVRAMPEPQLDAPYAPQRGQGESFTCRGFEGVIDRDWRVSSFTSFAAHDLAALELPDRDQATGGEATLAGVPPEPQAPSIFGFPRGAHAGIVLHEIFEKLDFSVSGQESPDALVKECLANHRFGEEWEPCVRDLVGQVVKAPLSSPQGPFSLSQLERGKWLCELEFFFPLKFVTTTLLKEYFRKWSVAHHSVDLLTLYRTLRFKPVKGMVRGFMDMVFEHQGRYYLVDWKSNHLGNRIEEYGRAALKGAMEQRLYTLQYLLYTVALNRYLTLRVPGYDYGSHFGGVIYFFLRGVSQEKGEEYGIFRDTPPLAMIEELTACLIQAGG